MSEVINGAVTAAEEQVVQAGAEQETSQESASYVALSDILSDAQDSNAGSPDADGTPVQPETVENESDDTITFRFSSMTGRLTKMFEDRITISRTGAGITMEGLRKEVFRMASALEYRLGSNE